MNLIEPGSLKGQVILRAYVFLLTANFVLGRKFFRIKSECWITDFASDCLEAGITHKAKQQDRKAAAVGVVADPIM
jgi:hypothetical protein